MLPKGPWTLLIKKLPCEFCENTLKDYAAAKNPTTMSMKGYNRGLSYVIGKKVTSLLLHYGSEFIYFKGAVHPSYRNFGKYGEGYQHKLHFVMS